MKKVVITGSRTGIGKCIVDRLLDSGQYEIHGLSKQLTTGQLKQHYRGYTCDLTNRAQLTGVLPEIRSMVNKNLDVLILNAGFADFKPFEAFTSTEIASLIQVNFTAHLQLTNYFLQDLLRNKGQIIVIGSHSAVQHTRWGGPYAAAKAGLYYFFKGLFEDYRKQGLKVTQIIPDIVNTSFYDQLRFEPSSNKDTFLNPDQVAFWVKAALEEPSSVVEEIRLRPQRFEIQRKPKL